MNKVRPEFSYYQYLRDKYGLTDKEAVDRINWERKYWRPTVAEPKPLKESDENT